MTAKIFCARPTERAVIDGLSLEPGRVSSDGKGRLSIGTGDGAIDVLEIQLSGKTRMKVTDLLHGFHTLEGSICH